MNNLLNDEYVAEAALNPNRIVKFGSTDDFVSQSAAATDGHIGVFEGYGMGVAALGAAANERVAIALAGVARVKLGGTVTRGVSSLTSDASGQAVAAAPAAGSNVRCIGYPLASGVNGDVIPMLIAPHTLQG